MNFKIDTQLTSSEINNCDHISTFGLFKIYVCYDYETYLIAIDSNNVICGSFEFFEIDDEYQLAHMNVSDSLKRKGIGKALIREAISLFGTFELPSTNHRDTYYYIENGLAFIHSCFNCGLLNEPKFKRPGNVVI